MTGRPPPLLIVGHGTRDAGGVAEFTAFVDRLARPVPRPARADVAGGFIELSRPPLADAVTPAGRRRAPAPRRRPAGARRRRARQGRHPGSDGAASRPAIPASPTPTAGPLWPHPALLDLVDRSRRRRPRRRPPRRHDGRARRPRLHRPGRERRGRARLARLLWEGRGLRRRARPRSSPSRGRRVPEAMERRRLLGARRIVVAPYFLFSGVLPDRVGGRHASTRPSIPTSTSGSPGVLGDCDELADARHRAVPRGDRRRHPDELRHLPVPGRVARPRAPGRGAADAAPPPRRPVHGTIDP